MSRLQRFIVVCSLATSETSVGQTPPDTGSSPRQFQEEIIVTGSHVPRKDLTSPGTTSFSAGVRNVFNVGPPVVYESFLTFADPSYDFVGRYFWGRIVHKF